MLHRIAEQIRPRARVRPSAWCRRNLRLTSEMGVQLVGPFRTDFYPWLGAFMDRLYDCPAKSGVVAPKPAQMALTLTLMAGLACRCATRDGRVLYVIGRQDSADKLVSDRWDHFENQPALKPRFEAGRDVSKRDVMAERNFQGGGIDFVGAKSPSGVSSVTYGVVVVDEFDQAMKAFPRELGSLHSFVLGRQTAVIGDKETWLFSHPTLAGRGIDAIFEMESDRSRWVFDCPHCHNPADLTHQCIKFRGVTLLNEPDPAQAVVECPACGREISDRDRKKLVWGPELGGSGRYWTDLDAADAARRKYAGAAINGLMNPRFGVEHFAGLLVSARRAGEAEIQATLNVHFGEAYRGAGQAADPEAVKKTFVRGARIGDRVGVPGGELGVRFVTIGSDVQFASGKANPWDADGESVLLFYLVSMAWAASGMGYVIDARTVLGWPAWLDYIRNVACVVQPGTGGGDEGLVIPASAAGIDAGFATAQVLEHCREYVYSPIDQRRIELVAMRYEPSAKADLPVRRPPDSKRMHPTRPELGLVDYWYLHRNTWVGRAMNRWLTKQEAVLCEPPAEHGKGGGWVAHLTANALRPVRDAHGFEKDEMEWQRPNEYRDDWLQAKAMAEAVAAIKCRLDRIHELPWSGGPVSGAAGMTLNAPSIAGIRGRRVERQ